MSKDSILVKTAQRLGIHNSAVLQKCEEFLRAYQAKGSIKTLNDIAKTVLCLDLSSTYLGHQFDRESALKLTGLKKSAYLTNLHNIEKILDLHKIITVANVCVQLNCTDAKDLAEEILNKYTKDFSLKDVHPQYITASVYVACKSMRIKTDQSEFVKISRLKPSQWKTLISDILLTASKMKNKIHLISEEITEDLTTGKRDNDNLKSSSMPEGYEEWKEMILKEAYAALKTKVL